MPRKSPLILLVLALALFAAACGSDDTTDITVTEADGLSQPSETDDGADADGDLDEVPIPAEPDGGIGDGAGPVPGEPIPVEPDGGIGDGAGPLPGADEPADSNTWHGAQVAETNCPGMEWQRVQASAFSFSVPADFVESDVQPVDSEVGQWTGGNQISVLYDYGWYSGRLGGASGAENEAIDYGGILGEQTIVRDPAGPFVGVYFGQVAVIDGQTDKLSLVVNLTDPNDEIIGRCIVGSIDWNN